MRQVDGGGAALAGFRLVLEIETVDDALGFITEQEDRPGMDGVVAPEHGPLPHIYEMPLTLMFYLPVAQVFPTIA